MLRAPSLRLGAIALGLAVLLALPASAEPPRLRVAVLSFGTVNWLTETITAGGHDEAAGYRLEVVPLAGKTATTIAFQSGEADAIVSDWVWASGRRETGEDLRFAPYSTALGALMARPDAGIGDLCDLDGRTVGVVGGAQDKSWIVYEALAARDCGVSLPAETRTLFGAPPLMSRQLEAGAIEAVSTYWHYASRLRADGMVEVIDVVDALARLGIEPAPALVGFVWRADRLDAGLAAAFLASVDAASRALAEDDAAWERLRPMMRAEDEATFEALRADYRAGIPDAWSEADTEAARALHAVLSETGGAAFRRGAGRFDAGLFDTPAPAPLTGTGNDG